MLNARRRHLPKNPTTVQDIDLVGFQPQLLLPSGESFVLDDTGNEDPNRMLILGSNDGLRRLAGSAQWHIDGTFRIVPSLFYQV